VLRADLGGPSADALGCALGLKLPTRVGEVTGSADGSGVAVLWLSPDEFLAVGQDEARTGVPPEAWAGDLREALGAGPGQVVDVSANRTTLELSGPRARSVLEKSCELDLHPWAFPVGTAVVTLLGSTGVIIWRTAEETWRVMPRASFTTHVVRWLLDGMREYR
jgi:sarcosine oxidase subunit gamma